MLEFLGLGSHRLKANPQLKEKSEDKAYANDVPFTITLAESSLTLLLGTVSVVFDRSF